MGTHYALNTNLCIMFIKAFICTDIQGVTTGLFCKSSSVWVS